MKIIKIILLLALFLLGGCDTAETHSRTSPSVQAQEPEETISVQAPLFVIPENWEWTSEDEGIAKLEQQRRGGNAPASKIVFLSAQEGSEDDARNNAFGTYEQYVRECESRPECNAAAIEREAYTMRIGETNLHVYAMPSKTWEGAAWQNNISFCKDGQVVRMILYGDPAHTYEQELRTIIESFTLG